MGALPVCDFLIVAELISLLEGPPVRSFTKVQVAEQSRMGFGRQLHRLANRAPDGEVGLFRRPELEQVVALPQVHLGQDPPVVGKNLLFNPLV